MVADERTNSVLISGEKAQRLRLKTLVTYLDTPLQSRRRHAGALPALCGCGEDCRDTQGAGHRGQRVGRGTGLRPPLPAVAAPAGQGQSTILADPGTNALVITAPPKVMRSLMAVIDKLDIRRAQVLVEAIIVEVCAEQDPPSWV